MCTELRNGTGKLYLTIDYETDHHWVRNTWSGPQTFGGVAMGADSALHTLRKHQCSYLLNDGRQVQGLWDRAVNWLLTDWLPRAQAQGLTHFANVVGADALGAFPAEAPQTACHGLLQLRLFEDVAAAQAWLREAQNPVGFKA